MALLRWSHMWGCENLGSAGEMSAAMSLLQNMNQYSRKPRVVPFVQDTPFWRDLMILHLNFQRLLLKLMGGIQGRQQQKAERKCLGDVRSIILGPLKLRVEQVAVDVQFVAVIRFRLDLTI